MTVGSGAQAAQASPEPAEVEDLLLAADIAADGRARLQRLNAG